MKQHDLERLAFPDYWNRRYAKISSTLKSVDGNDKHKDGHRDTPQSEHSDNAKDQETETETEAETFEWFRSFTHVRPFLTKYLPSPSSSPRILHLGCGNSALPMDLHMLGYHDQVAVDFSEIVIEHMQRTAQFVQPPIDWRTMDIRDLRCLEKGEDGKAPFHVVIDKGTMDSFFHGSMWDPPEDVRRNIDMTLTEVERVLRSSRGIFLYITYRQRHFMEPLLRREAWELSSEVLTTDHGGVFEYFGYVMKMKDDAKLKQPHEQESHIKDIDTPGNDAE